MQAAGEALYPESDARVESRSGARVSDRLILALIIALSVALSSYWAFRVPIFEEPDESAHFDYAISIATAHRLVLAREGTPGTDVHPYTRYLEDATNFRGTRYNRDGRVPVGYGTTEFFRKLDAGKPPLAAKESAVHRVPFIVRYYPFGFYAIEAIVMNLAAFVTHGSLLAMFFSARLFCVLLLPIGLLLSNAILTELRISTHRRLAIVFAIAALPMTAWVFGYVQPDNLAFILVSAGVLLGMRARGRIASDKTWIAVGLVLGALIATKLQFFIAVAIPVVTWLAICAFESHLQLVSLVRKCLWLSLPAAALFALCSYVSQAGPSNDPLAAGTVGMRFMQAARAGLDSLAAYVWSQVVFAYQTNFGLGRGLVSYWGSISWLMTPIEFVNLPLTLFVFEFISIATSIVAALMLFRQVRVFIRLGRIVRDRSPFVGLRTACRDLVLNTYLFYFSMMLTFSIYTHGEIVKQGRYWLPFIVAAMLCATTYAPQVLPKKFRVAFGNLTLGLLCFYSLFATVFALRSLQMRFYVPPAHPLAFEQAVHVDSSCTDPGNDVPGDTVVMLRKSSRLVLCGWALASGSGTPVKSLLVQIDNEPAKEANYGLPRPDVVQSLLDERFLLSGFRAIVPTDGMTTGVHNLRFLVVESDRGTVYARMALTLRVTD